MQDDPDSGAGADNEAVGLFPNDVGALPAPARRVLVQLLHGPTLDRERHPMLWPELLIHRQVIASRLSELFLELMLDQDLGVAFTRQVYAEEGEFPRLLRRIPLTLIDSALVLHLRQQLARAQARNERCVVSREDLGVHLALYARVDIKDEAGFDKRVRASIDKMVKHSLLHKMRNSDGRYEVAVTLKLLFPAEAVQSLNEQYLQLLAGGNLQADDEDEGEPA